jgi:hypothetical protein
MGELGCQASLCCPSNGVAIPLCFSRPSTSSPTRIFEFSLMVVSKPPPLHWSVAGHTFPGTAILISCKQVPLDHGSSVGFGVCEHDVLSGQAIPHLAIASFSVTFCYCCCYFCCCPCSYFGQDHFWEKKTQTLRWVGGSILSLCVHFLLLFNNDHIIMRKGKN